MNPVQEIQVFWWGSPTHIPGRSKDPADQQNRMIQDSFTMLPRIKVWEVKLNYL